MGATYFSNSEGFFFKDAVNIENLDAKETTVDAINVSKGATFKGNLNGRESTFCFVKFATIDEITNQIFGGNFIPEKDKGILGRQGDNLAVIIEDGVYKTIPYFEDINDTISWVDAHRTSYNVNHPPSGGTNGQVLTRTTVAPFMAWQDAPSASVWKAATLHVSANASGANCFTTLQAAINSIPLNVFAHIIVWDGNHTVNIDRMIGANICGLGTASITTATITTGDAVYIKMNNINDISIGAVGGVAIEANTINSLKVNGALGTGLIKAQNISELKIQSAITKIDVDTQTLYTLEVTNSATGSIGIKCNSWRDAIFNYSNSAAFVNIQANQILSAQMDISTSGTWNYANISAFQTAELAATPNIIISAERMTVTDASNQRLKFRRGKINLNIDALEISTTGASKILIGESLAGVIYYAHVTFSNTTIREMAANNTALFQAYGALITLKHCIIRSRSSYGALDVNATVNTGIIYNCWSLSTKNPSGTMNLAISTFSNLSEIL